MSAEVIDFCELLEQHAENVSAKLGDEPDLHADGGQALYNALPRELQKAFVHLACLMREGGEWPSAKLVISVAEYHDADPAHALCLMGWIPKREATDDEARCLALSKQVALGLAMSIEFDEPADLTAP